jgi:Uma2 family endonuclease
MPEVQTHISLEEYLAFERKAESRNEFVNGEILPVTGANRIHSLIVVNILGELGRQLEETLREVYAVKMRVRTPAAGAYLYPDVVAVREEPRFEDDYSDTLLNPSLVVEVFSKSTGS